MEEKQKLPRAKTCNTPLHTMYCFTGLTSRSATLFKVSVKYWNESVIHSYSKQANRNWKQSLNTCHFTHHNTIHMYFVIVIDVDIMSSLIRCILLESPICDWLTVKCRPHGVSANSYAPTQHLMHFYYPKCLKRPAIEFTLIWQGKNAEWPAFLAVKNMINNNPVKISKIYIFFAFLDT